MFYRFARAVVTLYRKLFFRVRYTFEAPLPDKQEAYILTGKHISFLDPILISSKLKRKVVYLAKTTLFHKKLYAKVLRALGAMPVSQEANVASVRDSVKLLKMGSVLGIFPEGTRIRDNELHRGGAGTAFIAKMSRAAIVPFGIYVKNYTVRLFSRIDVRFGRPIPYSELGIVKGTREEYERAMGLIMRRIKELSEADYASDAC